MKSCVDILVYLWIVISNIVNCCEGVVHGWEMVEYWVGFFELIIFILSVKRNRDKNFIGPL